MLAARSCLCALAMAVAACGAAAGNGDDDSDGPTGGVDAPGVIDASPPDAQPCVEGTAHATDPNGTCFVAYTTTRVPWQMARDQCVAIGGDLATITSAAENTFLTMLLGANEAFIGGTDLVTEGSFLWVDGTAVTYTNWRQNTPPNPNEPNNGGGGAYQEDCIVLQGQLAGVWDDRPCDSSELLPPAGTHYALCERP